MSHGRASIAGPRLGFSSSIEHRPARLKFIDQGHSPLALQLRYSFRCLRPVERASELNVLRPLQLISPPFPGIRPRASATHDGARSLDRVLRARRLSATIAASGSRFARSLGALDAQSDSTLAAGSCQIRHGALSTGLLGPAGTN